MKEKRPADTINDAAVIGPKAYIQRPSCDPYLGIGPLGRLVLPASNVTLGIGPLGRLVLPAAYEIARLVKITRASVTNTAMKRLRVLRAFMDLFSLNLVLSLRLVDVVLRISAEPFELNLEADMWMALIDWVRGWPGLADFQ